MSPGSAVQARCAMSTGARIQLYWRSMESIWGQVSKTRSSKPSMYSCRFSYCSFRPTSSSSQ